MASVADHSAVERVRLALINADHRVEIVTLSKSVRHRVDTQLVARSLTVESLDRADADFMKNSSDFSIGDVAPMFSAT